MTSVPRYRVATATSPPFVMYNRSANVWSGYCIDLINEARKVTNFDYDIHISYDSELGYKSNETGEWNGGIRELMNDDADMVLGPLWVTAAREEVIDFTEPIYEQTGFSILMLKDDKQWPFLRFLQALDYNIWACFAAAFLLTTLLIFFFERYSPFSYRNCPEKYADDPDDRFCTLKGCFWYVATCITPQGGGETPKNLSGKLAAAIWWLFGFIVVGAYTANLAGNQMLQRLEKRINSLDDLRNQFVIDYTLISNSSTERYFYSMMVAEELIYGWWKEMSLNETQPDWERTKLRIWEYPLDEAYTKAYFTMYNAGFATSADDALERMRHYTRNTGLALVGEATTIKYLVMTNCDVREVGEQFSKKPFAIAVQEGSPLRETLNMALREMKKRGKLEMLRRKWWDENPERLNCPESDFNNGLGLDSLGAAFVVIGAGILVALAILIVQYWWYCYRSRGSSLTTSSSLNTDNHRNFNPLILERRAW